MTDQKPSDDRCRTDHAANCIWAAAYLSRGVVALEKAASAKGDPLWASGEICALTTACIMTAWASVEAYANMLVSESKELQQEIAGKRANKEKINELDVFDLLLDIQGADGFRKGQRPYQDVTAIKCLRNAVVHFSSEWSDQKDIHENVDKALKGKYKVGNNNPSFSTAWAGSGCTQWTVTMCVQFLNEIATKAKVEPTIPDALVPFVSPTKTEDYPDVWP